MTFRVLDVLPILQERYGRTNNRVPSGKRAGLENQKVMGFGTSSTKVLALDVYPKNLGRVRLWIEPPFTLKVSGIIERRPKKCADLMRPGLEALSDGKGIYLEVETKGALEKLLDWYS